MQPEPRVLFHRMSFGDGITFYSSAASFEDLRRVVEFDKRAGLISRRADTAQLVLESQASTLFRMETMGRA